MKKYKVKEKLKTLKRENGFIYPNKFNFYINSDDVISLINGRVVCFYFEGFKEVSFRYDEIIEIEISKTQITFRLKNNKQVFVER